MKKKLFLKYLAGMLVISVAFVSCDASDDPGGVNKLEVTPSSDISFKADGNEDVVLSIVTDAENWSVEKTNWITVNQNADKLTVNAEANTTESVRTGRITISAGNAEPVRLNVTQDGVSSIPDQSGKITGSLTFDGDLFHTFAFLEPQPVTKTLKFELQKEAEAEIKVKVSFDETYVTEFNYLQGTNHIAFPKKDVRFANDGIITIPIGETVGTIDVTLSGEELTSKDSYMVALKAEAESDNVTVDRKCARVNFILKRQNSKQVRNIVYFEVNDTNPLNALEYELMDGTMFFDAVVIFSGNIHWDKQSGKPYMHYNNNIAALLKEKDRYIQPLRDRGIKVLMGILGDHDGSGVANLTEKGAEVYAQEIAEMCIEYGLDGVCVDDEYSEYIRMTKPNDYFISGVFTDRDTPRKSVAYFLERVNHYLKKDVPWETWTAVFCYGYIDDKMPDANGRKPGTFIDIVNENYGMPAKPFGGIDLSSCSMTSIECARGTGTITEETARANKEKGYGWCMWFSLDPNREPWEKLSEAAKGFYNQDLKPRTGYYKKIGEGRYDPNRYTR